MFLTFQTTARLICSVVRFLLVQIFLNFFEDRKTPSTEIHPPNLRVGCQKIGLIPSGTDI